MRNKKSRGLFDDQFRLEKISKLKDPLEKLNRYIKWEDFRSIIDQAFRETEPTLGGRPPFDRVMMFKVLVLQKMYNLSDDKTEYQILDRFSFSRFLGIDLCDSVPDAKTIWYFREQLKNHAIFDRLFEFLREKIMKADLILNDGSIVDARIIEVPKQRNSRDENGQLKNGEIPEDWKGNPNKLSQKDTDANWLKKNGKNHFGYKNHIKIDLGSKLITEYQVTPASVHDSGALDDLLNESDEGKPLWGDSAYTGARCAKIIRKYKMKNRTHKKGCRYQKLSEYQKKQNRKKSKVRARVEHVFGFMYQNLNGSSFFRYIGLDRIASSIGLQNIVYNLFRSIFLIEARGMSIKL
jgi:IS5 family transposase